MKCIVLCLFHSGLDLTEYCENPDDPEPVYNLFAVSNHFGGMGGGHCKSHPFWWDGRPCLSSSGTVDASSSHFSLQNVYSFALVNHCCCDTLCTNYLPQTQHTVRTRTLGSGTTMTTATSPRHQRATSWLVRLCCTVYSCSYRGSNALLHECLRSAKLCRKVSHISISYGMSNNVKGDQNVLCFW